MASNRFQTINGILVFSLALAITVASAKADIVIYSSAAENNFPGGPYNYVPEANDGTPNRPDGSELGNTVTFDDTARLLTTVVLGLFNGGGSGFFTLYLYGGSNPNTAPLLGSESANIGGGIYPSVLFNFTPLSIVLPNTITFIVSGPADNGHGPLSGFAPTIGTALDSMWYGSAPGNFEQNNTWAVADGAANNYLAAEFNATTPEPAFSGVLALGLTGLIAAVRRRKSA